MPQNSPLEKKLFYNENCPFFNALYVTILLSILQIRQIYNGKTLPTDRISVSAYFDAFSPMKPSKKQGWKTSKKKENLFSSPMSFASHFIFLTAFSFLPASYKLANLHVSMAIGGKWHLQSFLLFLGLLLPVTTARAHHWSALLQSILNKRLAFPFHNGIFRDIFFIL